MKKYPFHTPAFILALALPVFPAVEADATVLFSNDYESEPIGADTSTDPSGITGFRPLFPGATIRGDETATPFGADNRFVAFAGSNSRVPVHVTAVPADAYRQNAVMVAFDLYEPDGFGGRTMMGLGSGQWVPEVNFQAEIFAIEVNNGFLAGGLRASNVFGSLPILSIDQAYRLFMLMNMTDAAAEFTDPAGFDSTLGTMEMEIWIYDYSAKEYLFGGRWQSTQTAINDTIGFTFRHFSADNNVIYIDDMLIATAFDWSVRDSGGTDPVEPDSWNGYAVDAFGFADTGDWLGVVHVSGSPWIYQVDWMKWLYVPEQAATGTGAWIYISNPAVE